MVPFVASCLTLILVIILAFSIWWYQTRAWKRLASELGITYLGYGVQFERVFGHFGIFADSSWGFGWTNHQCQGNYRSAEVSFGFQICRRYSTHGGYNGSYQRPVFALRDPQLKLPHFFLRSENLLLDSLGSLLGGQDIDFDEDPTFSKRFVLQGRDADATAKLFSDPKVRAAFMTLSKSGFLMEAKDDTIVVRCKRSFSLRRFRPFLDTLVRIRDALTVPIAAPAEALPPGISDLAIGFQPKQSEHVAGSRWSRQHLDQVIRGYLKTKNYAKAEEMIALHIKLFEEDRFDMQVTLIKIWLQGQRPRHALGYVKKIYPTCLSNEDKQQLQKLGTYAQKQIESGVAEKRS